MLEKLFQIEREADFCENRGNCRYYNLSGNGLYSWGNPSILHDAGMDRASVFMATAISAGFASIVMGLVANYPVALAAGMGVNALFAYTICWADGDELAGCIGWRIHFRFDFHRDFCYRYS